MNILKTINNYGRSTAANALGLLKSIKAVDILINFLDEIEEKKKETKNLSFEDEQLQISAIKALGEIGDRRAANHLINFLNSRRKDLIKNAAYALGLLRDSRAVEPLIKRLKDKRSDMAEVAVISLGDIQAIEPLIEYYQSSRNKSALTALG